MSIYQIPQGPIELISKSVCQEKNRSFPPVLDDLKVSLRKILICRSLKNGDIQIHITSVKDCLLKLSINGENLSGHTLQHFDFH